jgi:hypothetical protein
MILPRVPFIISVSTNEKQLPLWLLVGVDGDLKTFVAAAALLPDETTISFTWALEAFARAMGPEACRAVHVFITDDDSAEINAITNAIQVIRLLLKIIMHTRWGTWFTWGVAIIVGVKLTFQIRKSRLFLAHVHAYISHSEDKKWTGVHD